MIEIKDLSFEEALAIIKQDINEKTSINGINVFFIVQFSFF